MSDINKINFNDPYNVRINNMGADRKYYRDPAEDEQSKNQYQQSKQQKQSQAKPQNAGMEQMLEALRRRQEQEARNNTEYVEHQKEHLRELNKQASEDYVRQVKEYRQAKAKQAEKAKDTTRDFNARFSERVKDIGKDHIAKILDKKIEQKTFEDTRKMAGIQNKTQDGKKQAKLDHSKLRPEVSKLLDTRRNQAAEKSAQNMSSETRDNNLLNLAVNKLKNKLGGAHSGVRNDADPIFKPILQGDDTVYEKMSQNKANISIEANLNEVKHSFDHAKALAKGGDNTYIPLETADIQKALFARNLPAPHATVEALKGISQQMENSTPLFLQAAVISTMLKVPPSVELIQGIMNYLDTFLKYGRWSTINKLYRFLVVKQQAYLLSLKQASMPKPSVNIPLDDPIFLQTLQVPTLGEQGAKRSSSTPMVPMSSYIEQSPLYHTLGKQVEAAPQMTEADIAQAYAMEEEQLKQELGNYLKKYGLPSSKVMINQLFQSAQGDAVRAQALALQLAQKKGLKPEVTDDIQAKLNSLTPKERQKKLPELLDLLEKVVPNQKPTTQSPKALGWKGFFQQYFPGFSSSPFEGNMSARESMLWMGARFQNTAFLKALLPLLSEALKQAPEATLQRIVQLSEQFQTLQAKGKLDLSQFETHAQDWLKATHNFLESRTPQLQVPPILQNTGSGNVSPLSTPLQELLQTQYPGVNFQLFQSEAAKESMLLLHSHFERTDFLNKLMPQLRDLLRQAPENTVRNLAQLLPLLKEAPEAKLLNLQTLYQSVAKFLQTGKGLDQVKAHLQVNLTQNTLPNKPLVKPSTAPAQNTTLQTPQSAPAQAQAAPTQAKPQGPMYITQNITTTQLGKNIPADQSVFLKSHYPGVSLSTFAPHPVARESLVLLHTLAERNQSLNELIPRLTQMFRQSPNQALETLSQLKPLLQAPMDTKGAPTSQQVYQQVLGQLFPEAAKSALPTAPQLLPLQNSGSLEALLGRFYGQTSFPALGQLAPEAQGHLQQFHQVLGLFEPNSSQTQALSQLLQHPSPELSGRLSTLSNFMNVIFEHLGRNPYQAQLLPSTLQNRLVQDMVQLLKTGQSDSLKATVQKFISEPPSQRDPLRMVQDRLRQFDVQLQNPAMLQEIWQMSKGSPDRLDALALLSKGQFPLFEGNIKTVLQYIQNLPPQTRFLSASQILKFLSGDLIQLINQQISGQLQTTQAPLTPTQTQFAALEQALLSNMPLLPENLQKLATLVQQQQVPPAFNPQNLLEQVQGLLKSLGQVPQQSQNWLAPMQQFMGQFAQELQTITQLFSQPLNNPEILQRVIQELPRVLERIQQLFQQLETQLQLPVQTQNKTWYARLPAMLSSLLQQLPPQSQLGTLLSQMIPQLNQGLPALAQMEHQLLNLAQQMQNLTGQSALMVPPSPAQVKVSPEQIQALQQAPLPQELEAIQTYLRTLGLEVSPQMLQDIQTLMAGSQDRLDAIGILMKGQIPLLPAHIQVVANYVKNIPRHERFQSISKILMFLSDSLIEHMKQELKSPQNQTLKESYQQKGQKLTKGAEAKTENMLKQLKQPASDSLLEAARYLLQSPLPKTGENLQQVHQVLNQNLTPKALFQELGNLMQQLQYLMQNKQMPASAQELVQNLAQYLQDLQQILQPAQQNLGHWMMGIMAKLQDREQAFLEQLKGLNLPINAEGQGWLKALQGQFDQIFAQLLQAHPELQEEVEQLKQALQHQLQQLQGQLESMHTVMQSENHAPTPAAVQSELMALPQTIIPLFLDNFKYAVQMALQEREPKEGEGQGEKGVNVSLSVQTHTLGTLLFSFELTPKGLRVRLGVQDAKTRGFIQPYLDSLTQKLAQFPWEIAPVQSYVLSQNHNPQHLLAQRIQTRYRRSAIDAL